MSTDITEMRPMPGPAARLERADAVQPRWSEPRRLRMQTECDHTVMGIIAILVSAAILTCMVLGALGLLSV